MRFLTSPVHTLPSAPASPAAGAAGQWYYDVALKRERYWRGTSWADDNGLLVQKSVPQGYTTGGDGRFGVVFPVPFADGVISIGISNATLALPFLLVVPYDQIYYGGFACQVFFNGAVLANASGIAVTWVAAGTRP